jgi:hypothetical protein
MNIAVNPGRKIIGRLAKGEDLLAALVFPRYLWVVERLACLRMTLLTISTGTPDLEA